MAVLAGFQQNVNLKVDQAFPGDIIGARTAVTLGAKTYYAQGNILVGTGCFFGTKENTVKNIGVATDILAGFVVRNTGASSMPWSDASRLGYSMIISDGYPVTVATQGDFAAIIYGVDATGTVDHVPILGEIIWIRYSDGVICSALTATVVDATKFYKTNWRVSSIRDAGSLTLIANSLLCVFSGTL